MCGRYSCLTDSEITKIRETIKNIPLRIHHDDFDNRPNKDGETRPTNKAPVIIHQGTGVISIENLRWGFKKWDNSGVIINARVETLHLKAMISKLLYMGRCVVPAGEYYEWEKIGWEKVKHFIKDRSGNLLLFMAGLYRESSDGDGREYVIITKDADDSVAKIHDRMPVLLRADQIGAWLSGELSPEDITRGSFILDVSPCDDSYVQLSLECL